MKRLYHHDHHGGGGHPHIHEGEEKAPADLTEAARTLILARHMLEHNEQHAEEMKALAERFEKQGQPEAAAKVRTARARMVEADLALLEAVEAAAPKEGD